MCVPKWIHRWEDKGTQPAFSAVNVHLKHHLVLLSFPPSSLHGNRRTNILRFDCQHQVLRRAVFAFLIPQQVPCSFLFSGNLASRTFDFHLSAPEVDDCVFTDGAGSFFCKSLEHSIISEKCREVIQRRTCQITNQQKPSSILMRQG